MKRLLLPLLLLSTCASAEVVPQSKGGDSRILDVIYDADQIVALRVAPNTALALELPPAERIENVAVGTNAGWQITPNKRGDHLFIKSSGEAAATNLIVVTDARQYLFSLVVGDNSSGLAPYILRVKLPSTEVASASENATPGRYKLGGSREIRPVSMSDDGRSTTIAWADDASIPAIYSVDSAGRESLVNGAMRGGAFVVDAISPKYVFRSGALKASAVRKREKAQ